MRTSTTILLVEDSPSDAFLVREALGEVKIPMTLHVVQDGEEALAFVRKEGSFSSMPTPDVILLDLNLPRKDGRQVLTELKADPLHCVIPVVIMTTSSADRDIFKSYQLHASGYIVKPLDVEHFFKFMRAFAEYWCEAVSLPANDDKASHL